MDKEVFEKTMENVRKHRDIKLAITERRRNYLVSEPNYHATKLFCRKFISSRNEIKQGYLWINRLFRTFNTRIK